MAGRLALPSLTARLRAVVAAVSAGGAGGDMCHCHYRSARTFQTDSASPRRMSELKSEQQPKQIFRISDYDCIGFDLDNTILQYNIRNVVKLEYETLSTFLVEEKGYDPKFLLKPIDENVDFLQKGLIMDYENKNVVKIDRNGAIQRASYGTEMLDEEAIERIYGKEKKSDVTIEFAQNMLHTWNGPMSERIRSVLDYFDMPAVLAFARCVDSIKGSDEDQQKFEKCDLYNDITSGLVSMFSRENFTLDMGGFFPTLKKNPDLYLRRCSVNVKNWLQEIKNSKKTFLITGSNVDFASFTASYCLGEDWRSLFDVVVCYARKPGFFTARKPFLGITDGKEHDVIAPEDLQLGGLYSQGNWQDMYELFQRHTSVIYPKCVYIGDNLVQDVFTPNKYTCCDVIAVSEEMRAEGVDVGDRKDDVDIISSKTWDSYFLSSDGTSPSLWGSIINEHAAVCLPGLDALADKPLDFSVQSFDCTSPDTSKPVGYFPAKPF